MRHVQPTRSSSLRQATAHVQIVRHTKVCFEVLVYALCATSWSHHAATMPNLFQVRASYYGGAERQLVCSSNKLCEPDMNASQDCASRQIRPEMGTRAVEPAASRRTRVAFGDDAWSVYCMHRTLHFRLRPLHPLQIAFRRAKSA